MLYSLDELQASAAIVHSQMAATAQFSWPLLNQEMGCEVWVKHENHTPTGAFKVRGGITYMQGLLRERPDARGIVTATRGNHGQSQARAASAAGLVSKIVVPVGNASEKNAAMRAFGAQVIVHGEDFEAARARARQIAQDEGLVLVPPFHPDIVKGVASYALELMSAVPDLEALYVPIGC